MLNMGRRRLLVHITTIEALRNCSNSDVLLLYVDKIVLREHRAEVEKFAEEHAYKLHVFPARVGVYLSRNISPEDTSIVDYSL